MKDIQEVTACVVDYGSFISLSERLSTAMKKVYIYTPFEEEFLDIRRCIKGVGLSGVERLDDPMEPDIFKEIDLWCFPDIGYGGFQRYLKSVGKAVWGSMGASDLELSRTGFLELLKELDLPMIKSERFIGISALADHLKTVKDKWVKINRFRENMETWHHLDWVHSSLVLDKLSVIFGPMKEHIIFVVQDNIESDIEIGYDGWCVDGEFPVRSFQGYEKKNELYLGSLLEYSDLPEPIRFINDSISKVLREYGYRNFIATEIRMKDDVPYFIDPTMRMPGQTGEQLLNTCSNLPEVVWKGANGELIEPEFQSEFAAEGTMHHTGAAKDDGMGDAWKSVTVPNEVKPWAKWYHYCEADGSIHFPPHKTDELGVLLGLGDTIEEAIDHLKENLELLKDQPIHVEIEGFVDLLKEVHKAEEQGVEFTDQKVPEPEAIIADA